MFKREFRFRTAEMRAEKRGDKNYITGYAAVFNSLSEPLYYFRERILPGAFTRALKEKQDVRELINHDPNLILGRTVAGTLSLTEDDQGLKFDCELPDTSYARDLVVSMDRGDISQCSFGFSVVKQAWITDETAEDEASQNIRELHDVNLFDVSVVTYPAYPDTSASARNGVPVELRSFFPDGVPEDIEKRTEKKTKKIDGEELRSSAFAYVGKPDDPATWRVPIRMGKPEQTRARILRAIAHFSHIPGIPVEQRQKVWDKVAAAAGEMGITVSAEDAKRAVEPRGNSVDCNCQCGPCLDGNCGACDNEECDFDCPDCPMQAQERARRYVAAMAATL